MLAEADDVDRIMAVMACAFDPEFGEAWTRRQVEDALILGNCHYLLAGVDGVTTGAMQPAGPTAGFALSRTSCDEEELLLFAVAPEYRGCGIGEGLLAGFAEAARHRGAVRLLLEMRRGNPAESLYRRHGFVPVGVRKNYYRTLSGPRLDAITFVRTMDA
ncbi:GNAT family N-acetyltransferase [Novosphingobium piscinae]|uniref:GNAT family N-acetyltransferase n=1 Tax=Novosphingobium piscinae TaxID=1507448 RepID=A0A7X1KP09_9SPHN|nr:GNAT family N-acetyltransferase [Novosphingobium piscinae]MBC2668246.1 GNAT family N-acetyltransferase [Novosphingobium piscinae]